MLLSSQPRETELRILPHPSARPREWLRAPAARLISMVGEGFCSHESAGEPHVEPCVCGIPVRCPVSPLQGSAIPATALGVLTPGAAGSRAGLLPPSPALALWCSGAPCWALPGALPPQPLEMNIHSVTPFPFLKPFRVLSQDNKPGFSVHVRLSSFLHNSRLLPASPPFLFHVKWCFLPWYGPDCACVCVRVRVCDKSALSTPGRTCSSPPASLLAAKHSAPWPQVGLPTACPRAQF